MKITMAGSNQSKSIYITKSYRDNGKSTSKTVLCLGKISDLQKSMNLTYDEVVEWAREKAKAMTLEEAEEKSSVLIKYSQSKRIPKNKVVEYNGGYLFLQSILYELGLEKLCENISKKYNFEFDLTSILSRLVYNRILEPSSKNSVIDFSKKLLEKHNFELHQIYRALDILSKEKDFIEETIYQNSNNVSKRNTSVLYYDCTNYYFEIEQSSGLKQYGKSKENRPNPIVQMGLFLDSNGIPLAFNINSGNTNEQVTLLPIEKRIIRDYNLSKFIVCTDAGLASIANRKYNNIQNRAFVVTQSLKTLKEHLRIWALDNNGWRIKNSNATYDINKIDRDKNFNTTFFKECWINENGLEQRLIVSYSLKYKEYQESIREGQVARAEKLINSKKKTFNKNPNSPNRFLTQTHHTKDGEVATEEIISIDESVIEKEKQYDGFYGVCTTLEYDISQIIEITKRRWEIEESFRIMKNEFKARPVYLQKDNRIISHFLICYLSLIVYRLLETKLGNKYTIVQILNTLNNMNFQKLTGDGFVPLYERTELTDDLHELFGFNTDYELISTQKMKKIFKHTKNT